MDDITLATMREKLENDIIRRMKAVGTYKDEFLPTVDRNSSWIPAAARLSNTRTRPEQRTPQKILTSRRVMRFIRNSSRTKGN